MKSFTSIAYKIMTAFMIVMMALTVLPVSSAFAAVSQPAAWSQRYAGTAYPAGALGNYAIAAGSNRLLVVAISSTRTAAGNQTVSNVTYGGQALTLAQGDAASTGTWNHTYLYYLNDAGITAAVGTSLNVTVTGGTSHYTWVYAAVFAGVDQTTPVTNSRNFNSNVVANDIVGPFATTLTVDSGDQAIEIINVSRGSTGNAVRDIDTWATGWGTNGGTVNVDVEYDPGGTNIKPHTYITTRAVPGATTNDGSQHSASNNDTWDSMTAMSINAVALTPTTTTITSDTPDPSVVGQNVAVNYTVTAGTTGNVTVSDGVNNCTGTVAAGTCTLALATVGARTLTATYAGDATFAGSVSAGAAHTVNKANTTTTINNAAALGTASVVGQAYAVTYTVAPVAPGTGTPGGNVTVSDGVASNTCTVAAGTCNLTSTTPGAKTITATYAGDANFNASAATTVPHTVNKANTTTTITSDNPDASLAAQTITVNFTVAAVAPGAGTRTGNVTVTDSVDAATCTAAIIAAGTGSCTLALTTTGAHTLTATYAGDTNFNGSADTDPHTVNASFTVTTSAGAGGTLTPATQTYASGATQNFKSTPNAGNILANLTVDTVSVGRFNDYTLANITGPHTIVASFDSGWFAPTTSSGTCANTGNALTSNDGFTVCGTPNSAIYSNFNFNIPAGSTVDGVEVAVEGHTSGRDLDIALSDNAGSNFYAVHTTAYPVSTADQTQVLGGSVDTWGIPTPSVAAFSNASFRLQVIGAGGGGNYSLDQIQVKVHYRQPTTLVVSAATGTYGGTVNLTGTLTNTVGGAAVANQTVTFYLNGTNMGTAVTNASGIATLNGASLAGINVGAYTGTFNTSGVTATYAGTAAGVLPGYLASNNAVNTLTVTKATLTVTAQDKTKVYGDVDPAFTFLYSGFQNGDTSAVIDTPPTCTVAGVHVNIGTYAITCAAGVDNNYNFIYVPATLTITPADLLITASSDTMVYGGTVPTITPIYTGLQAGDLVPATAPTCSTTATSASSVGSYPSSCIGAVDPNYTITYADGTVAVTAAAIEVTADPQTKAYNAADPAFTYQITNGALVGADNFTGALTRVAGEDVGTYAIQQGTLALNGNYTLTFVSADLTITPLTLEVTADPQTKVYGTADPALTYQITNGALVAGDNITGALTRVAGENVGLYAILQGTLTAGGNYTLTYVGDNLQITTRAITVTADPKSKLYGASDPALTYQVTSGSLAVGDSFTGALTRVPGENVGTYAILQDTLALTGNYVLSYVGDDLTITNQVIEVTADPQTKVYGNADPALTYQITSGALAVGDTFSGSLTRAAGEDIGAYAIQQGTLALSGNYTLNFVSDDLTITKRSITVTADPQTKVYGAADPALTYQITAGTLVAGDNFTGGLTRAAGEAVGTYAIGQGTLALSTNYTLNFVSDDLTITTLAIEVTADPQAKVYGNADPALTYQITNGALVAGDNFTGALTRAAGENVGAYAIGQGTLALTGNYTLTYVNDDLTITKRPIEVTAVTDTKSYDGNTSSVGVPTITAGTLVGTDAFTFTQTFDTKDIGTNKAMIPLAVISSGDANNYAITYVNNNTGVVAGVTVSVINISANNKVYNGDAVATLNTGTAQLVGVAVGDDVQLDVTAAVGTFNNKNVGNGKVVTVSGLVLTGTDAANYGLIAPTGIIANITTRPITVTAQTDTKVYDGNATSAVAPSITTGTLAAGDTANFTQAFANQNVGTSKTLTPSGAVTDGNGGGNYLVTFVNDTTGVITALPITVTADAKAKAFGDPDPALTFNITNGALVGGDSLSGSLTRVAGEAVGSYAIQQGSLSAGPNYNFTYVGASLTISIVNQTITVVTPAPANAAFNSNFNVTATASSGLPVAITTTGAACTGSGSTSATIIMLGGTGICTIHFNQAGNVNFGPALEVLETTNAQKADQTISVNTPAPANATFNTGFNVAASSTSGLAVTYSATGVCTNVGANFTVTSGTGVCTVQYNQAGNANYNAAPQVTNTTNAQKANQTINVNTSAPATAVFGSNFTVAATATSGLPVAYSATGSCTNAGATFTMTLPTGICTVQYNQAGNANYNAATQVTQTTNAQKANQTITVTTSAPASAPFGTVFTVAANSSSGLAVAYTSAGSCTNVGATFTVTSSSGSCTVQYNQAGNANFNAAPQVTEFTNSLLTNQTINVTTPAPANAVVGSNFTVAATASSGLPVTYSSLGSCSNVGSTFTMTTSTGTCTVQYNQAGNVNFNPAPQVTNTVNAQKANQSITVTTPAPANAANGANFTVAATASSGLPVVYSATGTCTNVGATFTMTGGAGTCTVHYNQPGNVDYNAAPELTSDVASQAGTQTINVTTSAPATAANGTSFNVAATSSSGLAVAITTSGDCSGNGNGSATINITGAPGTCTVHYNQAGDANYSAATEVTEDTTTGVDASAPAVTVNQAATQVDDPTNTSPINFTVVFNETVTGFTNADITIGGTAGATTAVITGAGPTYNVAISGMTGDGTVIITIPANAADDASSNGNLASTSTDNKVTYLDGNGPNVQVINTSPATQDQILSNAESVTFNIATFTVKFNQPVYDPAGDGGTDDVTNPNNYLLIRDLGDTAGLQTASCAGLAVVPADTKITTGTVSYDNETYTATFTVNGGLPLSNGDYHLFICGTTSIVDPLNNALALVGSNGPASDLRRSFTVSVTGGGGGGGGAGAGGSTTRPSVATSGALIPVTGFDPNKVTILPKQPADKAYTSLDDIRIEIPSLGITFPIVGVPETDNGWNLTWLKDSVGYLENSAYPTFNGNTVLTAHVRDANKNLGPFSDIKGLKLGDRVLLHAYGKIYVYEVQENAKISPNDIATAFKHEEYAWITLVTCEDYNAKIEEYYHRRMVRAVLISVVPEP